MELPVWMTVFISGIVGGWVGRILSTVWILPFLIGGGGPELLVAHWQLYVIVGGLVQAAVTGAVLLFLLPALSSIRVTFGTAFLATAAGNLVAVGGTLLLLRVSVQTSLAGGGVGLLPAAGLLSLGFLAVGIFVTSTMVSSAALGGDGGQSNQSLYGGQAYLDEVRKQDQG